MPASSGRHVFLSGRFDNKGPKETRLRQIERGIRERGWAVFSVNAGPGMDFGIMTERGLADMHSMVAVAYDDYGQKTNSASCTFYEVGNAVTYFKPIIAVQFCDQWPPEPPGATEQDRDDSRARLRFAFGPSVVRIDARSMGADECAAQICAALHRLKEEGKIAVMDSPGGPQQLEDTSVDPVLEKQRQVLDIFKTHDWTDEKTLDRLRLQFRAACSRPKIALAGPSSAGKSTLLSAICGRLVLPERPEPNSILPVHIWAPCERAPIRVRFVGALLVEHLADGPAGMELTDAGYAQCAGEMTLAKVYELIDVANSCIREVLGGFGRLEPDARRARLEELPEWRAEVEVPAELLGEGRAYTFIDCPGGGEVTGTSGSGGATGGDRDALVGSYLQTAVQIIIRCQIESACVTILVVRLDNSTPLTDAHQLNCCFGGLKDKKIVLAINAVDADSRSLKGAQVLEKADVQEHLDGLQINSQWRVGISAKLMLCSKMVDSLTTADHATAVDLDAIFLEAGLAHLVQDARDRGLGDAAILREAPPEEVVEELQAMAVPRLRARSLVTKLKEAARAAQVPLLDEAGNRRNELDYVYRAVFPFVEPEEAERTHRQVLPEWVRTAEEQKTDNKRFRDILDDILGNQLRSLVAHLGIEMAIRVAEEKLKDATRYSDACKLSIKEAKELADKFEELATEPATEELAGALELRLQRWLASWAPSQDKVGVLVPELYAEWRGQLVEMCVKDWAEGKGLSTEHSDAVVRTAGAESAVGRSCERRSVLLYKMLMRRMWARPAFFITPEQAFVLDCEGVNEAIVEWVAIAVRDYCAGVARAARRRSDGGAAEDAAKADAKVQDAEGAIAELKTLL